MVYEVIVLQFEDLFGIEDNDFVFNVLFYMIEDVVFDIFGELSLLLCEGVWCGVIFD